MARDKVNARAWRTEDGRKKKLLVIESLGGGCLNCGKEATRENMVCFDFHHIKQEEKSLQVTSLITGGYSLEKIMEEASKCVLFCACCHRLYHQEHGYNNFKEVI